MSDFDALMRDEQIAWRRRALPGLTRRGRQNGGEYDHVLPAESWEEGLWEGIRTGTPDALPLYLTEKKIQRHTGSHNLLSSWVLCANLYYPFRADPFGLATLAAFLRTAVAADIAEVTDVQLEWVDDPPRTAADLLGETGGSRGSHQTSPDVAFRVRLSSDERHGVVLTESKFTEHSFYDCSARRLLDPAQRVAQCELDWRSGGVLATPDTGCAQHRLLQRRYLHHVGPVLRAHGAHKTLSLCPAARGGYQLMRQQALAEALANTNHYGRVVSAVAWHRDNPDLMRSLRASGIADVRTDWKPLAAGVAGFATFTHQAWVAHVRGAANPPPWTRRWAAWIGDRYRM